MLKRVRKSSSRVTLVLIGVAALSACGNDEEQKRDVYKSREDCLADWNNKPADCTPATESRHAGSGFFYGPYYYGSSRGSNSSWTGNARPASRIGSMSSPSRGGFGSSGRSFGSSSS
jgi:hypothetical protein